MSDFTFFDGFLHGLIELSELRTKGKTMEQLAVLIVGAGPSGLTMALALKSHNIPFRIIDKQIKPVVTSNALAVQPRTLEVWNDLGILPSALAKGSKIKGILFHNLSGKLSEIKCNQLLSQYKFILSLSQANTESLLHSSLSQQGINIELETELINVEYQGEKILATIQHKDKSVEKIIIPWLIACDGGHSIIRQKLNINFSGKELSQHFVFADFKIEPNQLQEKLDIFLSPKGFIFTIPFNKKYLRVIADVSDDIRFQHAKSISLLEMQNLLKERCQFVLSANEMIWSSGFWIHEKLISSFSDGDCVFFVGDAAHLHSPAGGQGMNLGIQDAYNLAWKLAMVIKGQANKIILKTYQEERYALAKSILKKTTLLTKIMTAKSFFLKTMRNYVLLKIIHISFIQKKLINSLAGLEIRYKENLLVKDCIKTHHEPKAGKRMLDVEVQGKNLFDLVRGNQFCLLIFTGKSNYRIMNELLPIKNTLEEKYYNILKLIIIKSEDSSEINLNCTVIEDIGFQIHHLYGVKYPSLFLIRPDKYIGFRGRFKHTHELLNYLHTIEIGVVHR